MARRPRRERHRASAEEPAPRAPLTQLREQQDSDPVVLGSGRSVRSLLPHGLVDRALLVVHPIVLGSGRRLFGPDDQVRRLRLLESTAPNTGVLIVTYGPRQAGG